MKEKLYKQIKKFHKHWKTTPSVGFLAGLEKTSKQTVFNCLHQLEEEKKIKITSKKNYKIDYKII